MRRLQTASRRVLKRFAGPQHRLFSDDSRSFHFFDGVARVGDSPVTAEKLDLAVALVRDAHSVVEEPLVLKRMGVLRSVLRFDLDADIVRDGFRRGPT